MTPDNKDVLQNSSDSGELAAAALLLARAPTPEGHQTLAKRLQAADFLGRLDTELEYRDTGGVLRVGRVLEALSENKAPSAHATLAALTQSPAFKAKGRRTALLIEACAVIRPAPPEVVKFWDEQSQPRSGNTGRTIGAIVRNGSEPALKLLETKMADPNHSDDHKINWMRFRILPQRNDLPLLQCCERMLKGKLAEDLRPHLIDTLFDWLPAEWYGEHNVRTPPPREELSDEAGLGLRDIGEHALGSGELTRRRKQAIESVLEELPSREP